MTERILWMMTHPDEKPAQTMKRFEISPRTYWRDKEYIRNRLWNYEVTEKPAERVE